MRKGSFPQPEARALATASVYTTLLVAFAGAVAIVGPRPLEDGRGELLLVLLGIVVCSAFSDQILRSRAAATVDAGVVVGALAIVLAGPLAAVLLAVIPDLIRLIRRGRRFWNLGVLANLVSYLGAALAGAAVLALLGQRPGTVTLQGVLAVGIAMVVANYVLARLLFAVLRHGERAADLLRKEFLPVLPIELAMLVLGGQCGLLIKPLGVFALVVFAVIMYLPQLGLEILLRAPSAAHLPVEAAAEVYREALIDDLRLSHRQARAVRCGHSLIQYGRADQPLAGSLLREALDYALEAEICERWRPTQPRYRAPIGSQVLLVSRAWAGLTAQGTAQLSHGEALGELALGWLDADAPTALAAAVRIAEREQAVTQQPTPVPRLHRLPVPHAFRGDPAAAAVGRLVA